MEQALADTFHVCLSTVRKAIRILEKQGIALFRPNHGFFPARSSAIVRFHHSPFRERKTVDRQNPVLYSFGTENGIG